MHKDIDQYLDRLETTSPGQVYCQDCRYLTPLHHRGRPICPPSLRRDSLGPYTPRCWHPHARQTRQTWRGKTVCFASPAERNAQNNCLDFAPKTWWQRWGHGVVLLAGLLVVGYLLCWGLPWQ